MKNKKLLFIGVLTAFLMLAVPFAVISFDAEDVDADSTTNVARIGVNEYETLQAAITEAKSGDTIEILNDFSSSEKITIEKNLTIDGNNHTYRYGGYGNDARAIDCTDENEGTDLKISNLKVSFDTTYSQRGITFNSPNGSLTLDDVTIEGGSVVTYAINVPTGAANATINIDNSSITGRIALNLWASNLTIVANGTTFTSVDPVIENYKAIGLNNNGTDSANGTSLTINGGAIIAYDEGGRPSTAISENSSHNTIVISPSTQIVGAIRAAIAAQFYENTTNFYTFYSLQGFVDDLKTGETITEGDLVLLRDVVLSEGLNINGLTTDIEINGNGHTLTVPEGAAITVGTGQTLEFSDITLNNEGMIISEGTVSVSESGSGNVTVTGNGVFTGTNVVLPDVTPTESSDMGDKTEFSGTDSIVIKGDGEAQSSEVTFNFSDGEDKITITFPKDSVFDNVSSVSAIKWNTGIEEYGEVYDVRFYGIDAGNGDILITLPRTSLDGIVSVKNIDENGDVLERMEIVDITADYITFSTTHNSLYAVSYTQLSSGSSGYYPDDGIDSNIIYIAEIVLIVLALAGLAAVIRRN